MKSILFCIAVITLTAFKFREGEIAESSNRIGFIPPPDSILFIPNERADWESLQTYVVMSPDTIVTVELLLVRNSGVRTDWTESILIGRLHKNYAPNVRKDTLIVQPSRTWKIAISEKGKCMIRLVKGDPPRRRNGFVIPIKMKYKI